MHLPPGKWTVVSRGEVGDLIIDFTSGTGDPYSIKATIAGTSYGGVFTGTWSPTTGRIEFGSPADNWVGDLLVIRENYPVTGSYLLVGNATRQTSTDSWWAGTYVVA